MMPWAMADVTNHSKIKPLHVACAVSRPGIYFSAHWCPPCRAFTPKLRATYETLTKAGKPFEIVFASSDNNEEQFSDYYSEMPWASLPYNSPRKAALGRQFGVSSMWVTS